MHFTFQINEIIINVTKKLNPFSNLKSPKIKRLFSLSLQKFFPMSETFLFIINGFKELKHLRWLVWLKGYGYFRHEVTTSALDLLSRKMVILLLLLWLLLRLLELLTCLNKKPFSFCLVLDIFICLQRQSKNNSFIINSY